MSRSIQAVAAMFVLGVSLLVATALFSPPAPFELPQVEHQGFEVLNYNQFGEMRCPDGSTPDYAGEFRAAVFESIVKDDKLFFTATYPDGSIRSHSQPFSANAVSDDFDPDEVRGLSIHCDEIGVVVAEPSQGAAFAYMNLRPNGISAPWPAR